MKSVLISMNGQNRKYMSSWIRFKLHSTFSSQILRQHSLTRSRQFRVRNSSASSSVYSYSPTSQFPSVPLKLAIIALILQYWYRYPSLSLESSQQARPWIEIIVSQRKFVLLLSDRKPEFSACRWESSPNHGSSTWYDGLSNALWGKFKNSRVYNSTHLQEHDD